MVQCQQAAALVALDRAKWEPTRSEQEVRAWQAWQAWLLLLLSVISHEGEQAIEEQVD
jgi:hypothetical protein